MFVAKSSVCWWR